MRKGLYKWLLAVGVALGVASCDEQGIPDIDDLMSPEDSVEVSGEGLQIQDITFSDDHKVMTLSARLLHNVGEYDLADSSQVVVKALQEVKLFSGQTRQESQPVVTGVTNVSREQVVKLKLRLLVLVDLSVPQSLNWLPDHGFSGREPWHGRSACPPSRLPQRLCRWLLPLLPAFPV